MASAAAPDEDDVFGDLPPLIPQDHPPADTKTSAVSASGLALGVGGAAVEVAGAALAAAYTGSVHAVGATVGTATSLATRAVGGVVALGTRAVAGPGAATAVQIASDTAGATAGAAVSSSVATTGAVVGAVAQVGTSIISRNAVSALRLGGRAVGLVRPPKPPQTGATGADCRPPGADRLQMIERGEWVVVDTGDAFSDPHGSTLAERMAALSLQRNVAAVDVVGPAAPASASAAAAAAGAVPSAGPFGGNGSAPPPPPAAPGVTEAPVAVPVPCPEPVLGVAVPTYAPSHPSYRRPPSPPAAGAVLAHGGMVPIPATLGAGVGASSAAVVGRTAPSVTDILPRPPSHRPPSPPAAGAAVAVPVRRASPAKEPALAY